MQNLTSKNKPISLNFSTFKNPFALLLKQRHSNFTSHKVCSNSKRLWRGHLQIFEKGIYHSLYQYFLSVSLPYQFGFCSLHYSVICPVLPPASLTQEVTQKEEVSTSITPSPHLLFVFPPSDCGLLISGFISGPNFFFFGFLWQNFDFQIFDYSSFNLFQIIPYFFLSVLSLINSFSDFSVIFRESILFLKIFYHSYHLIKNDQKKFICLINFYQLYHLSLFFKNFTRWAFHEFSFF